MLPRSPRSYLPNGWPADTKSLGDVSVRDAAIRQQTLYRSHIRLGKNLPSNAATVDVGAVNVFPPSPANDVIYGRWPNTKSGSDVANIDALSNHSEDFGNVGIRKFCCGRQSATLLSRHASVGKRVFDVGGFGDPLEVFWHIVELVGVFVIDFVSKRRPRPMECFGNKQMDANRTRLNSGSTWANCKIPALASEWLKNMACRAFEAAWVATDASERTGRIKTAPTWDWLPKLLHSCLQITMPNSTAIRA